MKIKLGYMQEEVDMSGSTGDFHQKGGGSGKGKATGPKLELFEDKTMEQC